MLGLRHVALRVREIQRAVRFYTDILDMTVDWQPDELNVYLTSGGDNLALHQIDSGEPIGSSGHGALDHFGFFVSRPEEVDGWAARLEAKGVVLAQKAKTHRDGSRSVYFRDPDGNLIQLLYHPHVR